MKDDEQKIYKIPHRTNLNGENMSKEILGLPGWRPTPLYQRTSKVVQEIDSKLTKLIHTWLFLNAGPPMRVERHDGSVISYQGVAFKGSPVNVFWGNFIEPYLENYSIDVLEKTSALAMECQFSVVDSVEEAKSLLLVMVRRIYGEMADTDRILRGDGIKFPEKREVSGLIESMTIKVSQHAEIEKMKKPLNGNQTFNISNVNGTNVQFGNNNQITNISIQELVEKVASSDDKHAKSLLMKFLENSTVASIVGAGTSALLGML